ncbi:MAG TPA: hypothetical protein VGC13_21445 [Longimicrobium sp.]|jgi:hypothetical protein|uniref:hypothetical protein n=1 Tax=Longimicrobium sp. TaxID=2029185 RepID=UPI002ED93F57
MQSFNDPIDGTNAGSSGGSTSGSTGGGSTGGPGGGTAGGSGLSDSGLGGGGTSGGSTGGLGGSTGGLGGSTGGSTGGSGLGGSTGGGSTGGYGGSTGGAGSGLSDSGLGGSTGGSGLGGSTGGGSTGGYGGSTGGSGLGGSTGGSTGGYGGSTGGGSDLGGTAGLGDGMVSGTEDFELHEPTYRSHYSTVGTEGTAGTYDEARTGYAAGHAAASNPVYADRTYEEVEVDVQRDYGDTERFGRVREFARTAFEWKRVVAGVALVAGGYWASKKLFSAAAELSEEEERDCRTYYESHPVRSSGVPYSQARTVYVLGYVAGRNPEYAGRGYTDVEPHLRGGYTGSRAGSYDTLRDFGQRGYERGSTRGSV